MCSGYYHGPQASCLEEESLGDREDHDHGRSVQETSATAPPLLSVNELCGLIKDAAAFNLSFGHLYIFLNSSWSLVR